MQLRRPSAGTILGGLALFVALGGTAAAATGSLVNIADPSHSAHIAHVDSSGRLQVGDSAGPLSVKGSAVDPSPERVLATGQCNNNDTPVVATIPNTSTLRIRSISVSQIYYNGGGAKLSLFPPGASVTGDPLMNVFALGAGGSNLPATMDFGAGLTSSMSGNWTVRCGSDGSDNAGATAIWMVLGSN